MVEIEIVWRLEFSVWCLASGVWRSHFTMHLNPHGAFNVWKTFVRGANAKPQTPNSKR